MECRYCLTGLHHYAVSRRGLPTHIHYMVCYGGDRVGGLFNDAVPTDTNNDQPLSDCMLCRFTIPHTYINNETYERLNTQPYGVILWGNTMTDEEWVEYYRNMTVRKDHPIDWDVDGMIMVNVDRVLEAVKPTDAADIRNHVIDVLRNTPHYAFSGD